MFRVKYSREIILKLLYQIDVLGIEVSDARAFLENNGNFFKGLNEREREFIVQILEAVIREMPDIDALISKHLIGWSLTRLTPVDRNLIRMGIAESRIHKEKAIVIDDVVRISKKYGGEESFKIINAILDKVIQ
jgi:N utilization substance protein B